MVISASWDREVTLTKLSVADPTSRVSGVDKYWNQLLATSGPQSLVFLRKPQVFNTRAIAGFSIQVVMTIKVGDH